MYFSHISDLMWYWPSSTTVKGSLVTLCVQVIHVLDMTSAQLHSLVLGAEENLQSLHLRLEAQTQSHISPLSQELLLETGVSLDPRRPPSQCLPDGLVHKHIRRKEDGVFCFLRAVKCSVLTLLFVFSKVATAPLFSCSIRASTSTQDHWLPDLCQTVSTL